MACAIAVASAGSDFVAGPLPARVGLAPQLR